jgi:hypothetical protein
LDAPCGHAHACVCVGQELERSDLRMQNSVNTCRKWFANKNDHTKFEEMVLPKYKQGICVYVRRTFGKGRYINLVQINLKPDLDKKNSFGNGLHRRRLRFLFRFRLGHGKTAG